VVNQTFEIVLVLILIREIIRCLAIVRKIAIILGKLGSFLF